MLHDSLLMPWTKLMCECNPGETELHLLPFKERNEDAPNREMAGLQNDLFYTRPDGFAHRLIPDEWNTIDIGIDPCSYNTKHLGVIRLGLLNIAGISMNKHEGLVFQKACSYFRTVGTISPEALESGVDLCDLPALDITAPMSLWRVKRGIYQLEHNFPDPYAEQWVGLGADEISPKTNRIQGGTYAFQFALGPWIWQHKAFTVKLSSPEQHAIVRISEHPVHKGCLETDTLQFFQTRPIPQAVGS